MGFPCRKRQTKGKGRQRVERFNENWEGIYPSLVRAFLEFEMQGKPLDTRGGDGIGGASLHGAIVCIDVFSEYALPFHSVRD